MKKSFQIIIYVIAFVMPLACSNIVLAADQVDAEYIKLLENVNQQLSYKWNFFSVFLTVVTVVIAIIAVISAYILYMQNREYKERINETIDKYAKEYTKQAQKTLKQVSMNQRKMIKIYQLQVQKLDKNIEEIIKEYKQELEKIKATPNEKKRLKMLEEKLEELVNEKENLTSAYRFGSNATLSPYMNTIGLDAGALPTKYCLSCHKPLPPNNLSNICSNCQNWGGIPPGIDIS